MQSEPILWLCLLTVSCLSVATDFNKALIGFKFDTIENIDWLHCIEACSVDNRCISYNFLHFKSNGTCEMNHCGFADECAKESMLLYVPGCVFHQLAPAKSEMTTCEHLKLQSIKYSEVVPAHFTCDETMSIYADGHMIKVEGKLVQRLNCSSLRPAAFSFTITRTTQVVAFEVMSNKGPVLIGSFNDGIVTDSSWKCHTIRVDGWFLAEFNDTIWEEAETQDASEEGDSGGMIPEVSVDAKWIVTKGNGPTMYCRIRRKTFMGQF